MVTAHYIKTKDFDALSKCKRADVPSICDSITEQKANLERLVDKEEVSELNRTIRELKRGHDKWVQESCDYRALDITQIKELQRDNWL